MNQLKQSEISDCFFIGKTKRNIMEKKRDNMEYLFKEQSKRVKRGIKNMENSMYNSYNICNVDFEFATEMKAEGLLHGTRF